jgi:hypothetical protein
MTLLLRWRMPDPPLTLMWRGADETIAQAAVANPAAPVAAIIGPVGPAGPSFDLDNAVIDGGTFN